MSFVLKHRLRIIAVTLLVGVMGLISLSIAQSFSVEVYKVSPNLDLRGTWRFHNGDLPESSWNKEFVFNESVVVPEPLPPAIRSNLKNAFWYRTEFAMPNQFQNTAVEMALSLGSIKGPYKIYWNGELLGSAPSTTWEIFRIPQRLMRDSYVVLTVRVEKSPTIFEGIVHFNPVDLAPAAKMAGHPNHYYYETSLRPLIAGIFKLVFFLIFTTFYLVTPQKREFFTFALFSLFSAAAAASFSRIMPFYEDYFFKNSIFFLFNTLSLAAIPIFSADFLRLSEKERFHFRTYGYFLAGGVLGFSSFGAHGEGALKFYRIANDWLPALVCIPAIVLAVNLVRKLSPSLVSRKFQIKAFALFLLGNVLAASASVSSFLNYQNFYARPFIDLLIFAGLGASLMLDFQVTSKRSDAAKKMVPKWFAAFLSAGIQRVKLELPLIVLAVDTVGYTKVLASMSEQEREKFHDVMRAALLPLTTQFQGQKISERGDGGIFAWDYHESGAEREKSLAQVLEAARYLAAHCANEVKFRQGMAAGMVRGEMVGNDISFLGDPLIRACRLEPIAQVGTVLVDETLAQDYEHDLSKEWTEANIKGVLYRARPLQKAA